MEQILKQNNQKYNLNHLFKYSEDDLDEFISQYTDQKYKNLYDKRYMAVYFLYQNNFLNKETEDLLVNNTDKFRKVLEYSNSEKQLKDNLLDFSDIIKASENGNLEAIKYIIKNDGDVHITEDYPLRIAADLGYFDIVQFLTENGADINVDENYPIKVAAKNNHLKIVEYLVSQGANTAGALRSAAENGNLEIVKYLLSLAVDIDDIDEDGQTALRLAFDNKYTDIVKYLQQHGAEL
jgi:ankyrin repeat protein